MFGQMAAVGIGAAIGAWLRWMFGVWLNTSFPTVPPGTLLANLVGGYLIGVAMGFFAEHPGLPPEARLFAVTGFLGGLTTFSTFSAEVVTLIGRGQWAWAMLASSVHLVGSLLMTGLGLATVRFLRGLS